MTDIDSLTTPFVELEVFKPRNAWAEIDHIYLSIARGYDGLIWQIGFNGEQPGDRYYIRFKNGDAPWSNWSKFHDTGPTPKPAAPEPTTIQKENQ